MANHVPKVSEGTIPFPIPSAGKACETWYKIVGDLSSIAPNVKPLIVVHGGPGLSHDYLESLGELFELYGIPVVLYDQIGNGKSTHLKEKRSDEGFWVERLFVDELFNLTQKLGLDESGYDLLGHSWGGMMGATFASLHPKGLRRLILSHSPADIESWTNAYNDYRKAMPQEVQDVLKKHEDAGTLKDPEYEEALMKFFVLHMCSVQPFPEEFVRSFGWAEQDDTVTFTM
jgi:proline-specific peptidase